MIKIIKKIFDLLTPRERFVLYMILLASIVTATVDVAGILSIMPFIGVVANPELVQTNPWLNRVYTFLGFQSTNRFLFFLGVIVLLFLIINNLFKMLFSWVQLRYGNMRQYSLSKRLLERYLSQPYIFFLNRNTSELSRNILSVVGSVISGVLQPCMSLIEKTVGSLFILIMLVIINPGLAITTSVVLGTIYAFIYLCIRKKLSVWGSEAVEANRFRYKLSSEALNGIKDLKILGRQTNFLDRLSFHSLRSAGYATKSGVVNRIPMYTLEILAFGGILCIVLYFLAMKQNLAQVLPLVALYAFAAKRLMPSLQGIFSAISTIRYNLAALDVLHRDIINTAATVSTSKIKEKITPLPFEHHLKLENISFKYPNCNDPVIRNISLDINANSTVGFVGSTGSGKTTLIDIVLYLLVPQTGQMLVDGVRIDTTNQLQWQRNLGYVPQHIFLSDDTVACNIAFGIPDEQIDIDKVKKAASIANISRFIESELPSGYDTLIGERGIRLSGGQRQRIGIARALYHDPGVLILDEATSALDGETEEAVMDAISNLSTQKTIIMIAHRLTTLKDCDVIYVLEEGRITEHGTYNELIHSSFRFRAMSRTASKL